MNVFSSSPDTPSIGQAITAYGSNLAYSDLSLVYVAARLGEIKDITDLVAGSKACLEVYANKDSSRHKGFGGKVSDVQTWFLLSIVSLDDAQAAELLIYKVRDALVQPFQQHATLGNAGHVYHTEILPDTGKFLKIFRNGQWLRAHLLEILTKQEWVVLTPPGVIS